MSENPLQLLFQGFGKVSECIQTNLSRFIPRPQEPSSSLSRNKTPLITLSAADHLRQPNEILKKPRCVGILIGLDKLGTFCVDCIFQQGKSSGPTTKEELGRATWTFLHTLAAQYPDKPTRQQKKDAKELMEILSRMYPCKECADHFKEVIRANPVVAGSHDEFSQWLCHVHNVVNRSLGKVVFPCERVDARWGKLECEQRACDLQGTTMDFDRGTK